MSILIFDALLLSVPVMLGLLGLGRGGTREAVTLIGVLSGGLLGALWRAQWGAALAQNMAKDQRMMEAVVFVVLLLSTTIVIGYGGAFLLPPRQQLLRMPGSRLAGGLLGSLNGLLLVGLLLWNAGEAGMQGMNGLVSATRLGALVGRRLPLLLLVLAAVVAVMIVLALVRRFFNLVNRANKAKPTTPFPSPLGRAGSSLPGASRYPGARTGSSAGTSWPSPAPGKVERTLDPLDEARRVRDEGQQQQGYQPGFRPPQDYR